MPELQLHLKAPHKPGWEVIVKSSDALAKQCIDLQNLQGSSSSEALRSCFPNGERIAVRFEEDRVVLQPNFPITRNGNMVRKGKEIIIPKMSGRHAIGIGNIVYVATVN